MPNYDKQSSLVRWGFQLEITKIFDKSFDHVICEQRRNKFESPKIFLMFQLGISDRENLSKFLSFFSQTYAKCTINRNI